jgi:glutamate--cysteine ligase
VLAAMAQDFDNSFVQFARAQSEKTHLELEKLPLSDEQLDRFTAMTEASIQAQKQIEASDTMPFEIYRQQYVSAERLGVPGPKAAHA